MDESAKEREVGEEGKTNSSEDVDPRLTNPVYLEAKKQWKRFLRGEITCAELQGDTGEDEEVKRIRELFKSEDI